MEERRWLHNKKGIRTYIEKGSGFRREEEEQTNHKHTT